ncbi:transcriptional regulator [Sporothrix eucalyptigena]|uniref:Transcriptional regulator n=1 Tax=Sporothrix eucalyptigena TaxID=1812306 RepID=A0ABP0AYA7_9PEZI
MNRPGGVPQSLRGIPNGFNGQQQQPQQARSVSSRLPNGKMGNSNATGWAFGSGVPLAGSGAGGLQNPRPQQQMGGNISFAQSLGGSQPATPLDLSEFPSLSNSSQLNNSGQASLWSTAGTRNIAGQTVQRGSNTPLSSQQGQQEDMFGSTARLQQSNQSSFRFGSQANIGQSSIGQPARSTQPGAIDDFPPLNRTANAGEIGQDRTANLMSSLAYGAQGSATSPTPQASHNSVSGLINELTANAGQRAASGGEVRSPVGTRPQETRSLAAEEEAARQKQDGDAASVSAAAASTGQSPIGEGSGRNGNGAASAKLEEGEAASNAVQDPLSNMAPIDRWGMKGVRTLLSNPEYSGLVSSFGLDLNSLGVDVNSNELLSTQTYSLFDGAAPRPAIPKFRLPECYKVSNVGPIENKISSFNEETLMWIFYSCPNDVKQQLAAIELNARNWRWHKRQQVWLTKDDLMMPQVLSMNHERGYYIVWDINTWRKERTPREITLNYSDLDNAPVASAGGV